MQLVLRVALSVLVVAGCGDGGGTSTGSAGSGPSTGGTAMALAGAPATGGGAGGTGAQGGHPATGGGAAGRAGGDGVAATGAAPAAGTGAGGTGGTNGAAGSSGASGAANPGGGSGGVAGSGLSGLGGAAPAGTSGGGASGAGGATTGRCDGSGGAYFVDSTAGDDAKDGRSPATAWRSLTHVNQTTLMPGESLCLRAGSTFTGELHPLGSGASGAPIVLDRYGEGAAPKVAAAAGDANALSLVNQEYWEINGLELTNQQSSLGDVRGLSIRASNAGTLTHVYVRGCFIHDVTGEVNWIGGDTADDEPGVHFETGWDASKRTGGIVIEVDASAGTTKKTKYDDIVIENNVISDTSFGGIVVKQLDGSVHWGIRSSKTDTAFTPHTNVIVRNNYLSQSKTDYGCNTIYLTGVQHGMVEGNVTKDAGTSAIELYYTDQVTVQHNETYGTKQKAGGADSNGIDTDKATTGSVIQYNYVHDNGDGILLCQFSFGDSVVRYNLIANNSRYGMNLHSDKAATNATYNNVFYVDGLASASLIGTSGDGSALDATYAVRNNIFHTTRTSDTARTGAGVSYDHNLYSGLPAVSGDSGKKTGTPGFVDPGSRMSGGMSGPALGSLAGFKLAAGSPALNAGVSIMDNGGADFWGTMLYVGTPDIGMYEAP